MRADDRATAEDVLARLEDVKALKGSDYIYVPGVTFRENFRGWGRWPRYFSPDGKPDDIVGHVLALRGYGPGDVIEFAPVVDRLSPYQPWFRGFDPLARVLLAEAQRQQDLGSTYGYILERTEWFYCEILRLARKGDVDKEM